MTYDNRDRPSNPLPSTEAHRVSDAYLPADLEGIRREFPRYQIGVEPTTGGHRYVAQRLQPGPGPHTVVTRDLAELRTELAAIQQPSPLPHRTVRRA